VVRYIRSNIPLFVLFNYPIFGSIGRMTEILREEFLEFGFIQRLHEGFRFLYEGELGFADARGLHAGLVVHPGEVRRFRKGLSLCLDFSAKVCGNVCNSFLVVAHLGPDGPLRTFEQVEDSLEDGFRHYAGKTPLNSVLHPSQREVVLRVRREIFKEGILRPRELYEPIGKPILVRSPHSKIGDSTPAVVLNQMTGRPRRTGILHSEIRPRGIDELRIFRRRQHTLTLCGESHLEVVHAGNDCLHDALTTDKPRAKLRDCADKLSCAGDGFVGLRKIRGRPGDGGFLFFVRHGLRDRSGVIPRHSQHCVQTIGVIGG